MTATLRRLAIGFAANRKANVAVIFALTMAPTIFLLGMGLDYTHALRLQTQLDAAADAAAIAATTPQMMAQSNAVAKAAAKNVFNATANNLSGLLGAPLVTVTPSTSGLTRTVTVSYIAQAANNFPTVLGRPSMNIQGMAVAKSSSAPNINFYLLLDDSPSMAIAANSNDINKLMTNTPTQEGGCGFACHQINPGADNLQNKGGVDNYALARNLGLTLRIDLVTQATASLMANAQATEQKNNNIFKAAIYTFDYQMNTVYAPSGLPSADLATAATQAQQNIQLLEVYSQNKLTSSNMNYDTDTNIEGALASLNALMPKGGGGTNQAADTPQEVVFLVTDGVDDMPVSSASSCLGATAVQGSLTRCHQPIDTTICNTIKSKNIRIAVLYTEYLQLPSDSWYNSYVSPFDQPSPSTSKIAQNLQGCASPGLFYDVQSGGDITAALNTLFQIAVATAPHLTN
jgi:Flp pilus assembly protein TadG